MMDVRHVKSLMIFHHPGPVLEGGQSGSQVRPWNMLQAFRQAGYEVIPVIGYGRDRKDQIRRIKEILSKGHRITFLYSESRSIPTLLTERHRLPTFPIMDFQFMRKMREAGVPIGLFYRDVFWRFEMYRKQLALLGRVITVPLYHYDWWWYRKVVDHLFLPSVAMADHLPDRWPASRLSALPPGVAISEDNESEVPERGEVVRPPLRLIYIGGVHPPNYDLTTLFEVVNETPGIELTLCCRENEWRTSRHHYESLINTRTKIVHLAGSALDNLYRDADVFAILWNPHEYLEFAAPVKLFEAVGKGKPIITFDGTETARIVRQNDWGWVTQSKEDMIDLLKRLVHDPAPLDGKSNALIDSRTDHTWPARAKEVASKMQTYDLR